MRLHSAVKPSTAKILKHPALKLKTKIYTTLKSLFDTTPDVVNGNTKQHDDQTRDRVFRFGDQKIEAKKSSKDSVDDRNEGVAKGAIRALCIGTVFTKNKNTCDGKYVKKHDGKHDIIEQCAVLT